jgi:hypothetical protein
MRLRPPFTPCRIFLDIPTGHAPPTPGQYIQTQGKRGPGSAYRIDEARQNRNRPERFNLRCTRWPSDQIPASAEVWPLFWYPRKKRAARTLSSMRPAT